MRERKGLPRKMRRRAGRPGGLLSSTFTCGESSARAQVWETAQPVKAGQQADFAGAQPDRKVPVLKEFIRRVSKKRFWCPEIPIQSALFFQAFTAPAQKVVHVDDDGEQIRRPTKNRNRDRSNRGGERGRGRGRGRGGGGGGGGGGDKSNKNTFTQDERKRCGPCPSRMTKDGVCPSDAAGTPWTCKFDHNCPRCPSKSHRAKFCKLCQV